MSHRHTAKERRGGARRSSEAGYAYILAMGIILAVIIGSQVILENLVTQGRREREEETIWRGNQWARAIRLYYHKTGHYPQTIDDLETGVPDVHFLRASAIKDPMEPDDGSWRFIYVNSTGQIIGSVRYATLQQMALLDLNNGKMPGTQSLLPGAVSAASLSSMSNDNGKHRGSSATPTTRAIREVRTPRAVRAARAEDRHPAAARASAARTARARKAHLLPAIRRLRPHRDRATIPPPPAGNRAQAQPKCLRSARGSLPAPSAPQMPPGRTRIPWLS